MDPADAADDSKILKVAASLSGVQPEEIKEIKLLKRSVDARKKNIRINLTVEILTGNDAKSKPIVPFDFKDISAKKEVIIIGSGPAGLFAALRLIELGLRPLIFERGKDVSARKIDIARISRENLVDPDSNYCFGEGGAGTFSDGKLYTRSKKRGDNERVLELLCLHGANKNILYEAHPHLGTDKLPAIITAIRKTITDAGGVFMLQTRIADLILSDHSVKGVVTSGGEKYMADNVILATGHSARDIYEMLQKNDVEIMMKPFAVGVRVEHPQDLIDRIQYHGQPRGEFLPAASYNLVKQIDGRGVFSFCMCPGGFIVPSATMQEEVVVNGMSPSGRNSPYANSGIVVEIKPEDLVKYSASGELAGLEFQKDLERMAWKNSGHCQKAPAQRLADFVSGKTSESLPKVSYFPGVTASPLHNWLPKAIGKRLRDGLKIFGSMLNGFITNEAVVLGVESRTSSPVRIPRDAERMEHIRISGLYPCGEGSGYSGGIVSSAVDGMKAADAIAAKLTD